LRLPAKHGRIAVKVLKRKQKKGIISVVPERLDDLWHLCNIITKGDEVCARNQRYLGELVESDMLLTNMRI